MPIGNLRLLLLTGFALLLAACGGNTNQDPDPDPTVIVSEDVQVLNPEARGSLTDFDLDLSDGSGELRFAAGDPALDGISVGDILASEPVPGVAEHGFLQRIVERRDESGEVVFVTETANLEDAFDVAEIEFSRDFTASDVVETTAYFEGVSLRSPDESLSSQQWDIFNFDVDFNEVLVEGAHGSLVLDGSFLFNVSADAQIDIGWTGLQLFEFVLSVEEAAEVTLTGDFNAEFTEEVEVVSLNLGSFTVFVGPVPVVFSFTVTIVVGASGEITAHLEVGATQSVELDLGARYRKGHGWQNLSDFNQDFDFPEPELSASAAARAYVGGRFGIMIYGLAGPYVYANASVRLDAELFRDPFWRLSACLDAGLGLIVRLPIVGELANYSHELAEVCARLGESPNQAPVVTLTSPADQSTYVEGAAVALTYMVMDFEQLQINVTVTANPGGQIFSGPVATGQSQVLSVPASHLCPGTRTYTVTATDARGASHAQSTTVTVSEYPLSVEMNTGLYDETPVYAGSFIFGTAFAEARNCSPDNSAEQDLIEWYLDDALAGDGRTLAHLLDDYSAGDTVTLQARYTQDGETAYSEAVEIDIVEVPGELFGTPQAVILEPENGEVYGCGPFPRAVKGKGYVLGTNETIDDEDLVWHVRRVGGVDTWTHVATGGDTTFTLPESLLAGPGAEYQLRLTAPHGTETGEAIVNFFEHVCN